MAILKQLLMLCHVLAPSSLPLFCNIFQSLKALGKQDVYNISNATSGMTLLERIEHLLNLVETDYCTLFKS